MSVFPEDRTEVKIEGYEDDLIEMLRCHPEIRLGFSNWRGEIEAADAVERSRHHHLRIGDV